MSELLALVPTTIDETKSLASTLSKSSLLPSELIGKEANVFMAIMAGRELGLPPMASLRGVNVIKGKPVLTADTMVAIVLSRRVAKYFRRVEASATSATYVTLRDGDTEPVKLTWTIDDAKTAGLVNGDNWKKYPRAMLCARCKAELARDVYPDVLAGCYLPDEAEEIAASDVETIEPRGTSDYSAEGYSAPPVAAKTEPTIVDAAPATAKEATPTPTSTQQAAREVLADHEAKAREEFGDPASAGEMTEIEKEIANLLEVIDGATCKEDIATIGGTLNKAKPRITDRERALMDHVWPKFAAAWRALPAKVGGR